MTKYYVYTVKGDDPNERIHAFVEDPHLFAIHSFNPKKMEFSGVCIEADSPEEASEVYNHPKKEDALFACDEPYETSIKRRAYELYVNVKTTNKIDVERDMARARINVLIQEIASNFAGIGEKVSEMSRMIRIIAPPEERERFSNKDIYNNLINRYAEQITRLQYRPSSRE